MFYLNFASLIFLLLPISCFLFILIQADLLLILPFLVRSFVLMNHLKYSSIKLWCDNLANDSLLQYLIGSFNPPNSSSHYDFIIRLTGYDPHLSDLAPLSFITKKKFKNKSTKGEKLI